MLNYSLNEAQVFIEKEIIWKIWSFTLFIGKQLWQLKVWENICPYNVGCIALKCNQFLLSSFSFNLFLLLFTTRPLTFEQQLPANFYNLISKAPFQLDRFLKIVVMRSNLFGILFISNLCCCLHRYRLSIMIKINKNKMKEKW